MYVPIILGTGRNGNWSEKVAKFMLEKVLAAGLKSEIISTKDYLVGATWQYEESPEIKALSLKIKKADGFVVVFPEYNHGYPGELKLLLDNFYDEYARKPVGFCGVSKGALGGARGVEQLRLVFVELHAVLIREAIYFSFVRDLFDEKGEIKDKTYKEKAEKFLGELAWYAKALKKAREESN